MFNVLVCDDDKEIVEAIEIYLRQEGYNVLKAYDGQEAIKVLDSTEVDLLIIDVMRPKLDGIRATLKIREKNSLPIIILSAKSEDADKILGLNVGADDYLTKPFELEELWARIQVQLRRTQGTPPLGQSVLKYRDWTLNLQERSFAAKGVPIELTSHEMGILKLLIKYPKKVFTKQEIFEAVWQQDYFVEDKTIHVHISNIRAKLKKTGTDQYIQTVWGIGFKLCE